MDTTDFVTLALLAVGGQLQGKTKLQKTVYLLGAITGRLEDLGFRPWFYGPYSGDVDTAITSLKSIGAIDQNVSSWGFDQSGFEVRRYDFRLNEQGKKFAEIKARQNPEIWRRLQEAATRLQQAGDINYMEMAIAAKTHFMLGQKQGPATMNELAQLAPRFGWQVTPQQIQQAAEYLKRMQLVQLAAS